MGRTANSEILQTLIKDLPLLHDSLKIAAIKSITFLTPTKFRNRNSIAILKSELNNPDEEVRGAVAYFFSRHPHVLAIHALARVHLPVASITDKYRLKAIKNALDDYYIQPNDSLLSDTLRIRVLKDLNSDNISWRHKLYEISMLSHFGDTIAFSTAIKFLNDSIPHLRE